MTGVAVLDRADLARAIRFVGQVVAAPHRTTIPVLARVSLQTGGSAALITGTDLDNWCTASVDVVSTGGVVRTTINPRLLVALMRGNPDATTVMIEQDDKTLTIKVGETVARINALIPIEDFPLGLSGGVWQSTDIIPADVLRKYLLPVMTAISTEETRYYLGGVALQPDEAGNLRMIATDGHRMLIADTGLPWFAPSTILPRKAAQVVAEAVRAPTNRPVTVTMREDGLAMSFDFGGCSLTCEMIDGTFPNWRGVLPKDDDGSYSVTLNAAALRRLPRGRGMVNPIEFDPVAGRMTRKDHDDGEISAPIAVKGARPFGFNRDYLADMTRIANGPVVISSRDLGGPYAVTFEDPTIRGVLMPMRV